ncbi:MAG: hypothetical protein JWL72_4561 [Ilumatobacteraceae bacterium]|nr:hypothetical protein [Ilumatobacteraceae bacterium]MCU1391223.1 hypothetical protein [Ilumatobacteraceae bacterium]
MTRIGVSGHRSYNNPEVVAAMTDAVLERVLQGHTAPTVISNLAEGADQLVAELVLNRPGAALEVVLPLPIDDYDNDFVSTDTRRHFDALLARASSVMVIDQIRGEARESAYERAGHAIVDACDVLVALWDGLPARGRGGTAEMVQYAIDHGVIVEVVVVERDPL